MFIKHSLLSGRHPDFRCQPFAYEDSDCFFKVPGFATIAVGKKKIYIFSALYLFFFFSPTDGATAKNCSLSLT